MLKTSLPDPERASDTMSVCGTQLDDAIAHFHGGDTDRAKSRLNAMLDACESLPQLHHNLGVIAAAQGNWDAAIGHFRTAIANDKRSNMTHEHIQSIHHYQSAIAFAAALGLPSKAELPELIMQSSLLSDSPNRSLPKSDLQTVSTVEYELYAWWHASAEHMQLRKDKNATARTDDWLSFYVSGYPAIPLEHTDTVDWNTVERDISFTTQDAVVVLKYSSNTAEHKHLLLLKLRNNRWQIYKETAL